MSKKLKDLEIFIYGLKASYGKNISINDLIYEIAKVFGYSDYHKKMVLNSLIKFGFIREVLNGVYEIIDKKKEKKEAEKETEKLLGNVKHGEKKKKQ